jgi:hypothetical protein
MSDRTAFLERLRKHRERTFRTGKGLQIKSPQQAVEYVNQAGFIFFWPVKGALLPSLWWAHAGTRPVADDHDDPGHVTWNWKDESLDKKVWYYAKFLRRRATFISLDLIPFFYALSPNYGEPEEDYRFLYEEGKMTQECKLVFEALMKNGPMDTISLRKAAHLSNVNAGGRFAKALDDLQVDLRVLPVGTAEVGAWKYSYVYDLTHRHFPRLIPQARPIKISAARKRILSTYFQMVGCATPKDIAFLFKWAPADIERTLDQMLAESTIGKSPTENTPNETAFSLVQLL